jgi:hypothetical protein
VGLLDIFRRKATGTETQTHIGVKMAESLLERVPPVGGEAARRRTAVSVAVFHVVADRLPRSGLFFDAFFKGLWGPLQAATQSTADEPPFFGVVEAAMPIISLGLSANTPAAHLQFGQRIAGFVDSAQDVRMISVSGPLSIEIGYEIAAATQLLQSLPAPDGR